MRDYEVVPDSEMIGWRGACTCGWQGEMSKRVTSPADADFSRRRDYVSLDGFADASRKVEDAIHEDWKAHIAPSEAILGVEAAAREYSQAGQRLDKTVAAAKAAGASGRTLAARSVLADSLHMNAGPTSSKALARPLPHDPLPSTCPATSKTFLTKF
jgi:hypothetical protein